MRYGYWNNRPAPIKTLAAVESLQKQVQFQIDTCTVDTLWIIRLIGECSDSTQSREAAQDKDLYREIMRLRILAKAALQSSMAQISIGGVA